MAQKSVYKTLGIPTSRKAFLDEFDGNVEALAGLQQGMEALAESNPEVAQMWAAAARNSGGDVASIVDQLANDLYPQAGKSGGVKGKTNAPAERMESGMPTVESKAEKSLLPDLTPEQKRIIDDNEAQAQARADAMAKASSDNPPAAKTRVTISPAARAHAAAKGVDLATVTGSGKNGAITKADIDKAAGGGTADAATPSPGSAAPAAKPSSPEDDYSDLPIPGAMGITRAELDALDEPIPGTMGLTRRDVPNYLDHVQHMFGSDQGDLSPPPAMDMSRLQSALLPTQDIVPPTPPSPLRGLTADEMTEAMGALDYAPPPLNLGGAMPKDAATIIPQPVAKPNPWQQMGRSATSNPNTVTDTKVAGTNESASTARKTMFGGKITPETHPVTSMKDAFFKARGLDGMSAGFDPLTRPADFAYRNPLLTAGAAIGGGYGMSGGQQTAAPQEVMDELDADIAQEGSV